MSAKKLDDFSPLPGVLPAGRLVLSGVRTETAFVDALREEFDYLIKEQEDLNAAPTSEVPEFHFDRH